MNGTHFLGAYLLSWHKTCEQMLSADFSVFKAMMLAFGSIMLYSNNTQLGYLNVHIRLWYKFEPVKNYEKRMMTSIEVVIVPIFLGFSFLDFFRLSFIQNCFCCFSVTQDVLGCAAITSNTQISVI